mmetsp:Transcript_12589/g.37808  ORF Transcript_12589/g.37808 Transcript_12589/m.37808 type:complete len:205 (+) Transcript_12589:122-736(+)
MRPFFTPRTSASDRSMRPPSVILLSMVVGPPATWTPVYVVLSSWKRTRSAAVVAVSDGPAAAATISWSFSTATRFVAAASSSACRNWGQLSFLPPLSMDLAKTRSSCVNVKRLSRSLQSRASFAKFFDVRPTPAFVPPKAEYSSNLARRPRLYAAPTSGSRPPLAPPRANEAITLRLRVWTATTPPRRGARRLDAALSFWTQPL